MILNYGNINIDLVREEIIADYPDVPPHSTEKFVEIIHPKIWFSSSKAT